MPQSPQAPRVGVWLVGARGSVATTAVAGAAAVRAGLTPPIGLVCEQPPLDALGLVGLGDLVFGGHDISHTPMRKRAEALAEDGVIPHALLAAVGADLDEADARVRPGVVPGDDDDALVVMERLRDDLLAFSADVDRTVVINLSSTEAPTPAHPAHASLPALRAALSTTPDLLSPSSLYAMAAFDAGCSFVEFTPSTGPRLPALEQLAIQAGVPFAGADGKTGETLVKAALAPMFLARALRVRSWAGTNLLGGGDGRTLADPDRVASKLRSKSANLESLLGDDITAPLHIDYVPDMGGWKTSWDHISFEGFLGVRMKMQFTWEGCDSALAAPLVLDLARLVAAAHAAGRSGALPELGFFFKDTLDALEPADLSGQYQRLLAFAAGLQPPV